MRFGVTILPELPWAESERMWRTAEDLGFDHAWTYDHLVWGGLPESPWYGTTPTLTAAALATSTIGLGTFVTSPNFRHPAALYRDLQSLDDVSGGRILLGAGTGGDRDSVILGGEPLPVGERVARFQEFVALLLRLRDEDHVTSQGRWFSTQDMRTLPRVRALPVLVAANGPRSVRFAATTGDGWVTTGAPAETLDDWFAGVAASVAVLDDALTTAGREVRAYPRYLSLDSSPVYSLNSADVFEDLVGRAAALAFTDVIVHWPRSEPPYAGREKTLTKIAAKVMPRLRGA